MLRDQIITQLMREKYQYMYQCLMARARASGPMSLRNDVEDCLQEAFISLCSQWSQHKDEKNLPGWLYLTALNNLRNRRRVLLAREKKEVACLDDGDGAAQQAAMRLEQVETSQEAYWETMEEMITAIRQCLSEDDFDFLLRYKSKEKTIKQLAQEMNVSENLLWKRKQRILGKIKKNMINLILMIILAGFAVLPTLIREGGIDDDEADRYGPPSDTSGTQHVEKEMSPEGAKVVASFLENLSADAFDDTAWELLMTCYRITDEQFGKDPVDVEKAVREHKKRLARYKAQMRKEARGTRHLSRRAAVALIVAACLVLAGAVCYGLGWTPWRIFTWQDDEHYNYTIYSGLDSATDLYTPFQPTGLDEELDRLLQEYEIYLPLPTWIPEGYSDPQFDIVDTDSQIWFGVCFSKDDVTLTIDVIEYRSEGEYRIDAYMEKDDEHYEEYAIGENKFIILSNMGRLQGLWLVEPYECIITGDIEPDEMRHIFESIVERS